MIKKELQISSFSAEFFLVLHLICIKISATAAASRRTQGYRTLFLSTDNALLRTKFNRAKQKMKRQKSQLVCVKMC